MSVQFYEMVFLLLSVCYWQEIASLSEQRNCSALDKKCLIKKNLATLPEVHCNISLTCSEDQEDACPPGLFCEGGQCECGVYPNYVYC